MKKTIISFCIIAIAATTSFTSCKKETAQPSNRADAGNVSAIIPKKPAGYTGGTGTSDSTKTKTNP